MHFSRSIRRLAVSLVALTLATSVVIAHHTNSARAATGTIEVVSGSAAALAPAKRLKHVGTIMYPLNPLPVCNVMNNYGDPRSGGRSHQGIDLGSALGVEIYAVTSGTLYRQVFDAPGSLSGNSWYLRADDGSNAYYFYAHMSAFKDGLTVGSVVKRGDVIGFVGDTGNPAPGAYHLHFEVHPTGADAVDPFPILQIPASCNIY